MLLQPITLAGAAVCLWVLYFRYRSTPKDQRKSTFRQKLKLAKILIGALLALIAINYSLRHLGDSLDGRPHDYSLAERVINLMRK